MIKHVPVILHGDLTPPGLIVPELQRLGLTPLPIHLHRGGELPEVDTFDHVVICGGAPNVDETAKYPFLKPEMAFIERTLAAGKSITGICLGAQLCAHVLGAKVYPHPRGWEMGWHDIEVLGSTVLSTQQLRVFQHHRYVFEKPESATILARNEWWPCQAFTWKDQVMAFQFHPETDPAWIHQCASEMASGKRSPPPTGNVQTGAQMIEQITTHHPRSAEWFARALEMNLKM